MPPGCTSRCAVRTGGCRARRAGTPGRPRSAAPAVPADRRRGYGRRCRTRRVAVAARPGPGRARNRSRAGRLLDAEVDDRGRPGARPARAHRRQVAGATVFPPYGDPRHGAVPTGGPSRCRNRRRTASPGRRRPRTGRPARLPPGGFTPATRCVTAGIAARLTLVRAGLATAPALRTAVDPDTPGTFARRPSTTARSRARCSPRHVTPRPRTRRPRPSSRRCARPRGRTAPRASRRPRTRRRAVAGSGARTARRGGCHGPVRTPGTFCGRVATGPAVPGGSAPGRVAPVCVMHLLR